MRMHMNMGNAICTTFAFHDALHVQIEELKTLNRSVKMKEYARREIRRLFPPAQQQKFRRGPTVVAQAGVPRVLSRATTFGWDPPASSGVAVSLPPSEVHPEATAPTQRPSINAFLQAHYGEPQSAADVQRVLRCVKQWATAQKKFEEVRT